MPKLPGFLGRLFSKDVQATKSPPPPSSPSSRSPFSNYRVTIHYREPSYEMRQRRLWPKTYRFTYDIRARNPEQAVSQAIDRFRQTEIQSDVGWVRDIIRTEVNPE